MAASSRSRARLTRRWQLHLNCRRIRQAWTVVYLPLHTYSISSTTRRVVDRPDAYPVASDLFFGPASIRRGSDFSSCYLRPARPALLQQLPVPVVRRLAMDPDPLIYFYLARPFDSKRAACRRRRRSWLRCADGAIGKGDVCCQNSIRSHRRESSSVKGVGQSRGYWRSTQN